jgi:hypothetical protein
MVSAVLCAALRRHGAEQGVATVASVRRHCGPLRSNLEQRGDTQGADVCERLRTRTPAWHGEAWRGVAPWRGVARRGAAWRGVAPWHGGVAWQHMRSAVLRPRTMPLLWHPSFSTARHYRQHRGG